MLEHRDLNSESIWVGAKGAGSVYFRLMETLIGKFNVVLERSEVMGTSVFEGLSQIPLIKGENVLSLRLS